MSSKNLEVALTLSFKDSASKAIRSGMRDITRSTDAATKTAKKQGDEQKKAAEVGIKTSRALSSEFTRAAKARETLSIRSEHSIRREIQQTEAAYNRLTRSGVMSINEQTRAYATMKSRISDLRGEMGQLTRMQRAGNIGRGIMQARAGITAASVVLAEPVKREMSYDRRLAVMTNTAYSDHNIDGREQGKKTLKAGVRNAVTFGGNKEDAAEALNTMIASGAMGIDSAIGLLPTIQKYSTSEDTSASDLAQVVISLKQSFGIQDKDIEKALNMAIVSGQDGSFELTDMAKFLPSQLAAAKNAGMSGLNDFAEILALNQAAAVTAGSSSEAGTNATNLLLKLTSRDSAIAASRQKYNGIGIDLPGSLIAGREQGLNTLQAFTAIVDKVSAGDKRYQALEEKLKDAPSSERAAILNSMMDIIEGSSVSRMVSDQGALKAFLGYRADREGIEAQKNNSLAQTELSPGQYAGDVNYKFISSTNDFQNNRRVNAADFAEMEAIKPLSDIVGVFSKGMADISEKFPSFATGVIGATTAIKTLAAAAIGAAGVMMIMGGGKGGLLSRLSAVGTIGVAGVGRGVVANGGKLLSRVLAPLALYQGINAIPLVQIQRSADKRAEIEAETGIKIPDFKTLSSAEIKALPKDDYLAGAMSTSPGLLDVWDEIKGWFSGSSAVAPAQPQQIIKVELDGRIIAEVVNEINGHEASRGWIGAW